MTERRETTKFLVGGERKGPIISPFSCNNLICERTKFDSSIEKEAFAVKDGFLTPLKPTRSPNSIPFIVRLTDVLSG